MQFIFGFSVGLFQIFALYFSKVVEIVRVLGFCTFVLTEEFPVFLGNKSMSAVRAQKAHRGSRGITGREGLTTDFTLILSITAIIVVDEMMRRTTQRAYSIFRNTFSVSALYWFQRLVIFPRRNCQSCLIKVLITGSSSTLNF